MSHLSSGRIRLPSYGRCPITMHSGETCGSPIPSQMPFDICGHHARKLFDHMNKFMASVTDDPVFRAKLLLDRLHEEDAARDKRYAEQELVVYYVQVGAVIKIGVTGNLKQRLKAYPPHKRLLAVEHTDDTSLETQRHLKFKQHLASGNEWFRPGPDLIEHINGIRARQGAPAIQIAA